MVLLFYSCSNQIKLKLSNRNQSGSRNDFYFVMFLLSSIIEGHEGVKWEKGLLVLGLRKYHLFTKTGIHKKRDNKKQ